MKRTIGIYLNGDYKLNNVAEEHLEYHIRYNLNHRPGRALVVDGEIVNTGYLTRERIEEMLKGKLKDVVRAKSWERPSPPYH